jgi:hypothetical protein
VVSAAGLKPILCVILFLAVAPPAARGQERSPGGQIYRELLPFVGLEGVRLEIFGLGGGIFNTPGPVSGDPEKTLTGLSRAEHQELERTIRADIDEAFRAHAIPLLPGPRSSTEVRPSLTLHIGWSRVKPDTTTIQVRIDLLEAARLVKDPSRVVWASTWGSTYNSISSGPDLAAVVRSVTRGQVNSFVTLYARAHAQVPIPAMEQGSPQANRLVDLLQAAFRSRNPSVTRARVLELRSLGMGAGPYVLLGWGIRPDFKFEGRFDDELFGVFIVDNNLTKIERTIDIFPTQRWADYLVSFEKVTPSDVIVVGAGSYGDKKLRWVYELSQTRN